MVFLSPQTFLFTLIYIFLLFFMMCQESFFSFWVLMELSTLVFMGMSYSMFKNNFSFLLTFFVIQSLAAFMLMIFYCISLPSLFTLSLFLKLSMFPFYFWYLNLVSFFPNFIFLFSSTLFKIPSVFIFSYFYNMMNMNLVVLFGLLTIMVGGCFMVFSSDLRFILICSSVVNNTWFLFSQWLSSIFFLLYFVIYSFLLTFLMLSLNYLVFSSSFSLNFSSNYFVMFCLFSMAGLPPFPLFFLKMAVVFFFIFSINNSIFGLILMIFSVLTLLGYMKQLFHMMFLKYTTNLNLISF